MNTSTIVNLLRVNVYAHYISSLCAGTQRLHEHYMELTNPKVGDLVLETSTFYARSNDPLVTIGELVSVEEEPRFTRQEAIESHGYKEDEEIPIRWVWTIKLVFDDGRLFRWENASFIKVLEEFKP